MNRVIHFEIHAQNTTRAAAFYGEVFGWQINEWEVPGVELPDEHRYWLITTGPEDEPGINGGMMIRRGEPPVDGQPVCSFVCTIGVDSIDDIMEKVTIANGKVTVQKMAVPGVGWSGYCKDTEGNIFGLMQDDPNAA